MNKIKRRLSVLILLVPLLSAAQGDSSHSLGIKWTTGLSWEQVKQKAKQENKYIFLDCFTTWCGPCKTMDQQVYPDTGVGNYFNEKFIAVKVQMDQTAKDDADTKAWYEESQKVAKEYRIEGYPTFIFFSPDGAIVDKQMGGRDVDGFIALAKEALTPGKTYSDPYAEYYKLKDEYNKGIRDYEKYPYMIRMAYKAGDDSLAKRWLNEHTDYVLILTKAQRYTIENVQLWAGFDILNKNGSRFQFFYKDGVLIDKVMNEKGYAARVIDKTIWNELVVPFMEEQAKASGINVTGMYLNGRSIKTDSSEADWKKLNILVRKKYGKYYADRAIVSARTEWYARHWNYKLQAIWYMIKLEKYTPNLASEVVNINGFIWNVFLHITDREIISRVLNWGQKIVLLMPNSPDLADSYANLLYKAGRINEAKNWESVAVNLAPADGRMRQALEDMIQGKRTYVNQGVVWE